LYRMDMGRYVRTAGRRYGKVLGHDEPVLDSFAGEFAVRHDIVDHHMIGMAGQLGRLKAELLEALNKEFHPCPRRTIRDRGRTDRDRLEGLTVMQLDGDLAFLALIPDRLLAGDLGEIEFRRIQLGELFENGVRRPFLALGFVVLAIDRE